MKKVILIGIILILIVPLFLVNVKSLEYVESGDAPFNLNSWLKHNLGIGLGKFSIVGDYRGCDDYPSKTFKNLAGGSTTRVYINNYCSKEYGLIDTYVNGWNPYKEFGNDISFYCKPENAPCNIEVYCCPYGWCTALGGNSYCRQVIGPGSECKTSTQRDKYIELTFNEWSYCTDSVYVNCWYIDNFQCVKRTYYGQTTCPSTYQGWKLYPSLSSCNGEKCSSGQKTCVSSSKRKYCDSGRWVEENCPSGTICSEGICIQQQNQNQTPSPPTPPQQNQTSQQCIGEEEIFYTKGYIIAQDPFGTKISGSFENYKNTVKEFIPEVINSYYVNKNTACCANLTPIYSETQKGEWSGFEWWDVLGIHPQKVSYSYQVYKCTSKENIGFCLDLAHKWLNPITHSDNCQTNTIYGFIAIAFLLVIFMALLRGGK